MRRTASILALLMIFSLACGQREREAATPVQTGVASTSTTLTPEQLGELGARIRKEPGRADEILSGRGQTRESFEKAIRDVTENPDASRRYAEAYRRASA